MASRKIKTPVVNSATGFKTGSKSAEDGKPMTRKGNAVVPVKPKATPKPAPKANVNYGPIGIRQPDYLKGTILYKKGK